MNRNNNTVSKKKNIEKILKYETDNLSRYEIWESFLFLNFTRRMGKSLL